jgi:4'-phosphopantetheinyl transferase
MGTGSIDGIWAQLYFSRDAMAEQGQSGDRGDFELAMDHIHIWYILAEAESLEACLSSLEACLSPPEHDHYLRLRLPQVRQNFLLSRGCLRYLLGHYLDRSPRDLVFSWGPYGKPVLSHDDGLPQLQFNLTHSQGRIAIALHSHQAIGIDLEHLRPVTYLEGLCQRCLTAAEARTILPLAAPQADYRFLRYWTAKEALLKALGVGLSQPMDRLEVDLGTGGWPQQPVPLPVTISIPTGGTRPGEIHLYQWCPASDYVAAVAVQGRLPSPLPPITLRQTTPLALVQSSGPGLPSQGS